MIASQLQQHTVASRWSLKNGFKTSMENPDSGFTPKNTFTTPLQMLLMLTTPSARRRQTK
jgi:hypothetical protein